MTQLEALTALKEAVEAGRFGTAEFDLCRLALQCNDAGFFVQQIMMARCLTSALALHEAVLPGWGWRVGQCHVSDDAAVFPGFNCPQHGARLRAEFDEATDWFALTDVDQRPPGNPARAWLISILNALISMDGPE